MGNNNLQKSWIDLAELDKLEETKIGRKVEELKGIAYDKRQRKVRKFEHKTKDLTMKKYSGEHDEYDCLNMHLILCHYTEESISCGFGFESGR